MNKDISLWATRCLDCQKSKMATHVSPPVRCIDVPSCRFSHIHVNLVGPLSVVRGFTHVFTIVDRSTCCPTTYPVRDTSADTCIAALTKWISGFRVLATLTSDRCSQFTSSSFLILASVAPAACSFRDSCGRAIIRTSASGLQVAWIARNQRWRQMSALRSAALCAISTKLLTFFS